MKLGSRLSLQISIVVFAATVGLLAVINTQLKSHAVVQAKEKAELMLAERQATIHYVVHDLRPPPVQPAESTKDTGFIF